MAKIKRMTSKEVDANFTYTEWETLKLALGFTAGTVITLNEDDVRRVTNLLIAISPAPQRPIKHNRK